jgi:adenosylhomocysteine nucleosidase
MMRTTALTIEPGSETVPVSVVVLSALNIEFGAVREHLTRPRIIRHHAGTIFETGRVGGSRRRIAAAVTGEGNHSAAIIAERAISMFNPEALLFVGVAGSLRPDVRLGDIVVATRIYGYHGGREEPDGFMNSPRCWETAHELSQLARYVDRDAIWPARFGGLPPGERPRVHFGPIAAGEVIVNSLDCNLTGHFRRYYSDAIAVEMESAGMAQASHLNGSLPSLTVRAISDAADGHKAGAEGAGWQARAAANAAAFAAALIELL